MKILGISTGHDSGASLVINGNLVAAINEERLTRQKLQSGFPFKSIKKILEITKLKISEIEYIAIEGKKIDPQKFGDEFSFNNTSKKILGYLNLDRFFLGTEIGVGLVRFILSFINFLRKKKIKKYFIKKGFKGNFKLVEHHLAHAASAYYSQEKDVGLSITMDAGGEGYCSHVYISNNNTLNLVHKITSYHSLVIYYAYITKILGFTPLKHEGKILGLSAAGDPKKTEEILKKYIYFDKEKIKFVNLGGYYLQVYSKLYNELKNFKKEDVAAGIQGYTEKLVLEYVNTLIKKFSSKKKTNVFLAGGLFANIKINQKIADLDNVNSCYIFPNMGDGGLSAGCALNIFYKKNSNFLKKKQNMFLGSSYNIEKENFSLKPKYAEVKVVDIYKFIGKELNKNKIFGIFNHAMEYGPRALGNRSIICSPKNKSINEILNKKLKRSEFMPFAPCVLAEDFKYFFDTKLNINDFEFMTFACSTKKICEELVPAIVHIDKSARPQAVFKKQNNFLHKILEEFKKVSDVGILINTSFNIHEEPIVESYQDALNSFEKSSLDFLVLDKKIIKLNG